MLLYNNHSDLLPSTHEYPRDVFVTNIPGLEDMSHAEFLKMFRAFGEIERYSIRRPLHTAIIKYKSETSAQNALQLNASYTNTYGRQMYVCPRQNNEDHMVFRWYRQEKFDDIYEYNMRVYHGKPSYIDNEKILSVIAQIYERIGEQHYALFDQINTFLYEYKDPDYGYYAPPSATKQLIQTLKVRHEGWLARKEKVVKEMCSSSDMPDDVLKHIVTEYMY